MFQFPKLISNKVLLVLGLKSIIITTSVSVFLFFNIIQPLVEKYVNKCTSKHINFCVGYIYWHNGNNINNIWFDIIITH